MSNKSILDRLAALEAKQNPPPDTSAIVVRFDSPSHLDGNYSARLRQTYWIQPKLG